MSAIPKPTPLKAPRSEAIVYPESDGKPMADNSKQFEWIYRIYGNLAALYEQREDVFVCGNQNWYPVQGHPEIVQAPDVYVIFGRPKGDRPSYKQWEEGGVPMTVVFEILSPNNSVMEMIGKQLWYEEYGVQEYYVFDPEESSLAPHLRRGEMLRPIRFAQEFTSPLLKVRFDLSGDEMAVFYPDGRRFLTFEELEAERAREHLLRLDAEKRAEDQQKRAEDQQKRAEEAENNLKVAETKLTDVQNQADKLRQRLQRINQLTSKLVRGGATSEDVDELKSLQNESTP
jgi:Uma2 family endonuclease